MSLGHKCNNRKSYKYEDERELDTSIINSDEEEKRKDKNCHRCGENWVLGHICVSNHLYHCKIINGKEVEVSTEEDL
jgi:hypothetical protein